MIPVDPMNTAANNAIKKGQQTAADNDDSYWTDKRPHHCPELFPA